MSPKDTDGKKECQRNSVLSLGWILSEPAARQSKKVRRQKRGKEKREREVGKEERKKSGVVRGFWELSSLGSKQLDGTLGDSETISWKEGNSQVWYICYMAGVIVNSMCQLDWAMGFLVIWSNVILSVSLRMFLKEINIWINGLSKADCSPSCGWASSNQLKTWIEQKAEEERSFPAWLLDWFVEYLTHSFLAFGPKLKYQHFSGLETAYSRTWSSHHWLFWVSTLPTADLGTSQSPQSPEPVPYNIINLSLSPLCCPLPYLYNLSCFSGLDYYSRKCLNSLYIISERLRHFQ